MKTQFIFLMMIALAIISCDQTQKKPIEGVWEMIYLDYPNEELTFPGEITGTATKAWTKGGFTIGGEWQRDTIQWNYHGWGTYSLTNDTHYKETIINHPTESIVGTTIDMIIIVRNDTLIQKWPVDDNWIPVEKHNTEKYIRLK